MARFEFIPRDDRSSDHEPHQVGNDRHTTVLHSRPTSHPSRAQAVTEHVAHDLAVARPDGPATRAPSSRRGGGVPTDDLLATLASANRIHGAPLPRVIRAAAGRAARPRREYGLRLSLNAFGGRLDDEANFVRKCLDVDLSFGDKFADSAALKRAVEAANGAGKTGHSTSLQRSDAREDSMARLGFAPRGDRSSKREPKRVGHRPRYDRCKTLAHPCPAQAANGSLLAAFANEGGRKKPGHASTLEKTEECAVCLLHRKDAVLAPCGHMCACFRCATRLRRQRSTCPICRAPIASVVKVYAT